MTLSFGYHWPESVMKNLNKSSVFLANFSWIHTWQLVLNVGLFLSAIVMGILATRRAFFILVLIPLAFIPFSYARVRLQTLLAGLLKGRPSTTKLLFVLTGLGVGCDVVMSTQLLTARSGNPHSFLQGPVISWIGAVWFSAHALLFLGYAIVKPVQWLVRLMSQVLQPRSASVPDTLASPERRQFLQHVGVVGAGAPFFLSLSSVKLSYNFRVEEHEITLPYWPQALDGLRIAHLSDIHVGSINRKQLLRIAALTNEAQPDIVLHTGDFLTHRTGDFDAPLYEALSQIHAPYGQWACLGNHDFDAPERLVRLLNQAGVTVLRNALVTLSVQGQPLEIAGLDYLFGQSEWKERYAQLLRSWSPRAGVPRILLNHDPRAFATLPSQCADLVLSGHTHGGHVGVQLGRETALTVVGLLGIPDQGIFHRGDMAMYVTRCVGFYGYPMRLGIPPEIALLTLRAPQLTTMS